MVFGFKRKYDNQSTPKNSFLPNKISACLFYIMNLSTLALPFDTPQLKSCRPDKPKPSGDDQPRFGGVLFLPMSAFSSI